MVMMGSATEPEMSPMKYSAASCDSMSWWLKLALNTMLERTVQNVSVALSDFVNGYLDNKVLIIPFSFDDGEVDVELLSFPPLQHWQHPQHRQHPSSPPFVVSLVSLFPPVSPEVSSELLGLLLLFRPTSAAANPAKAGSSL